MSTKTLSDPDLLAFILRVLRCIEPMECEDVLWCTDGEYAPVTFFVDCSDTFYWGTADSEDLTPSNIADLERAYADCRAAEPTVGKCYAQVLFCARQRGMRPQGAAYPDEPALWPLFDACGPEREVGLGNPKPHPSRRVKIVTEQAQP